MENNGFYIKYFEARGAKVNTVSLRFEKGCNVVLGKSDTGKTTLYNIIEYILGKSSSELTLPPEGDGYTDFYLELHTYDELIYTLRRSMKSRLIKVYACALSDINTVKSVEYSCSSSSASNISDFLLNISKVPQIYSKSSDTRNPTKITISMLRHLFMMDESKVSGKKSSPLLYSPNPIQQWVEKNLIAYLMTGLDDSEFRPNEDPKDKKSRIKGKIEFLEQSMDESQKKLETLGNVDYISLVDDTFIKAYRIRLAEISKQEEILYQDLNKAKNELILSQNKKNEILHISARLRDLRDNYLQEIKKLEFINTGSQLISKLQNVVCPLCGSPIEEHDLECINSSSYAEAIRNEYNSLYYKVQDLESLINEKQKDLVKVENEINNIDESIDRFSHAISSLNPDISELKKILTTAESNLRKKFLHSELISEIERIKKSLGKLKTELLQITTKKEGQRQDINDDFLGWVKSNLVEWKFMDEELSISFDYKTFDIKLGERHRSSYGKGNRSITSTAVIMALFDYCIDKDRAFSRLLIIDSPLCTKYGEKVKYEDRVQFGTIDSFARYCNTKDWRYQCIIIDNKFTESEDINNLHNINFIDIEAMGGLFRP